MADDFDTNGAISIARWRVHNPETLLAVLLDHLDRGGVISKNKDDCIVLRHAEEE